MRTKLIVMAIILRVALAAIAVGVASAGEEVDDLEAPSGYRPEEMGADQVGAESLPWSATAATYLISDRSRALGARAPALKMNLPWFAARI